MTTDELNSRFKRDSTAPRAVARNARGRLYIADDVLAYDQGEPFEKRTIHELRDRVMGRTEVAAHCDLGLVYFDSARLRQAWHLVPEPSGRLSTDDYWIRDHVDAWLADKRERNRRNSADRPDTADQKRDRRQAGTGDSRGRPT